MTDCKRNMVMKFLMHGSVVCWVHTESLKSVVITSPHLCIMLSAPWITQHWLWSPHPISVSCWVHPESLNSGRDHLTPSLYHGECTMNHSTLVVITSPHLSIMVSAPWITQLWSWSPHPISVSWWVHHESLNTGCDHLTPSLYHVECTLNHSTLVVITSPHLCIMVSAPWITQLWSWSPHPISVSWWVHPESLNSGRDHLTPSLYHGECTLNHSTLVVITSPHLCIMVSAPWITHL